MKKLISLFKKFQFNKSAYLRIAQKIGQFLRSMGEDFLPQTRNDAGRTTQLTSSVKEEPEQGATKYTSKKTAHAFKFYFLAVVVITIFVAISCQVTQDISPKSADEHQWDLAPTAIFNTRPADPDGDFLAITYESTNHRETYPVAELLRKSCGKSSDDVSSLKWRILFKSAFGSHKAFIEFAALADNKGAKATIDGRPILISFKDPLPSKLLDEICAAVKDNSNQFKTDSIQLVEQVKNWMHSIAPDCTFSPSQEKGWFCGLEEIEPDLATKELGDIQMTVIRSWNRQPYLLTRRLAVALLLANALGSETQQKEKLNKMCKAISYSKPIELPVALASKRWQEAVCINFNNAFRIDAAKIGLIKSFDEIEFLRQLFERTSSLGVLTVRVPHDKAPTKDLFVSLSPGDDVSQLLAEESKHLGAKSVASQDGDFSNPKACWHPLFGDDPDILQVAKHLDLLGATSDISCLEQSNDGKLPERIQKTAKYLADSITSETEFVITNGRSKLLRLPAGSYNYTIKGHNDALGWEDAPPPTSEESSSGSLVWAKRRPQAIINQW